MGDAPLSFNPCAVQSQDKSEECDTMNFNMGEKESVCSVRNHVLSHSNEEVVIQSNNVLHIIVLKATTNFAETVEDFLADSVSCVGSKFHLLF